MELSRYELAAVKRTAQIIKPKRAKMAKLIAKRNDLDNEINALQNEIDLWEAPIITKHGYSSEQILSGEADKIASQTENMPEVPIGTIYDLEQIPTMSEPGHTFTPVNEGPFEEPEF